MHVYPPCFCRGKMDRMSKLSPEDLKRALAGVAAQGADQADEPLSVQSVFWKLNDLDRKLRTLRRLVHDRDLRSEVMVYELPAFANLRPPTELGIEVDKGLISPIAAATLLLKSLQRSQHVVSADPKVLDDIQLAIDRFLQTLLAARAHLQLHGADPDKPSPHHEL